MWVVKSHGEDFDNVLRAFNQEKTIRKRRFGVAGR
jgi:hypothetical protein